MSIIAIVGIGVVVVLLICTVTFLRCFAFASISGRHALGVTREDEMCSSGAIDAGCLRSKSALNRLACRRSDAGLEPVRVRR